MKSKKASKNIFVDLGFDAGEAAVLQMRANLMSDLRKYIEDNELTPAVATERLGIAQSRVSELVRGKWEKFSLEMLITLEARVGRIVRFIWPPKNAASAWSRTLATSARRAAFTRRSHQTLTQ